MPYYNVDGTRRGSLSLEPGDEMLMRDEDIYGKTLWHDPQGNRPSQYIGLGKVVKPEHAGKEETELLDIGYEWHEGRRDFEPVEPLEKVLKRCERTGKKEKPKEVSQTIIIESHSEDVPALQTNQEESEQS